MDHRAAKDRELEAAQEGPEDQDFLSAAVLNKGDAFHNDRFTNQVIPAKAGIQDTLTQQRQHGSGCPPALA